MVNFSTIYMFFLTSIHYEQTYYSLLMDTQNLVFLYGPPALNHCPKPQWPLPFT